MALGLVFRLAALRDLEEIFAFIAADDPRRAEAYVTGLRAACRRLCDFPQMGVGHAEIRPGLRLLSVRRRALVAYRVLPNRIVILRVLSAGQDYSVILGQGG